MVWLEQTVFLAVLLAVVVGMALEALLEMVAPAVLAGVEEVLHLLVGQAVLQQVVKVTLVVLGILRQIPAQAVAVGRVLLE
jgi:hypothetical protein